MLAKEKSDEIVPKIGGKKKVESEPEKEETPEIKSSEKKESKEKKKEITLSDLPGVGPATVEKLNTVGYSDLMSVAVATPGEIIEVTGMTEAAAKKLIAAAKLNAEQPCSRASIAEIT